MNFIILQTFNDYISAHLLKGRLEEAGIQSWLRDEHTVTIDPILTNAIGGIKLMVQEKDRDDALQIIEEIRNDIKERLKCPQCGGSQIEFVSSNRKPINWLSAIATYFMVNFAIAPEKVYHCFDCGHEFNTSEATL